MTIERKEVRVKPNRYPADESEVEEVFETPRKRTVSLTRSMSGADAHARSRSSKTRGLGPSWSHKSSQTSPLTGIAMHPEGDSTTMIRLFGIVYVDEIGKCGATASEIVRLSDIRDKYNAEVSKGMRLARYVTVRPDWHFRI